MNKTIKSTILISAFVPLIAGVQSCTDIEDEYMYDKGLYAIDWNAAADSATTVLVEHYWSTDRHVFTAVNDDWTFLTSVDYSYWPQAHAMDVIIDAYLRTGDKKYSDMFGQWYEGVKKCNWADRNGYRGEYYDDSAWIALTMLRLYDATKDQRYLDTAKDLWEYLKGAWDSQTGGLYWATSKHDDKNSCTMGTTAILGARLYTVTKDESDLTWAKQIYSWQYDNLYNPATGAVYDGINTSTLALNTVTLSYNQGTFAGAAYELYKLTDDDTYLNTARKAFYYGATSSSIIDAGNNIIRDEGNNHNNELFKGIFMRYFVQILNEPALDPIYKNKFVTFFNNNAETLWRKGVIKNDIQMYFSSNWAQPITGNMSNMECQVAGCTLIEARALYEKTKQ